LFISWSAKLVQAEFHRMKKYAWTIAVALIGVAVAGIRSKWRILEILSGAFWGAILGFLVGLAAELEHEIKGKK
jgi:hypothetical protein